LEELVGEIYDESDYPNRGASRNVMVGSRLGKGRK